MLPRFDSDLQAGDQPATLPVGGMPGAGTQGLQLSNILQLYLYIELLQVKNL